jgi:hypothetical protein
MPADPLPHPVIRGFGADSFGLMRQRPHLGLLGHH